MTQMIRYLILNVLGLALAAFGAYAALNRYPSPVEFTAWSKALPTVGAMLAFSLSITAVIVGIGLLAPFLWRLRRREERSGSLRPTPSRNRAPAPRSAPVRQDDEYEPEPGDYDGDGHGANRGHGGGGGSGGGYYDDADDRLSSNGESRDFEQRRRRGALR